MSFFKFNIARAALACTLLLPTATLTSCGDSDSSSSSTPVVGNTKLIKDTVSDPVLIAEMSANPLVAVGSDQTADYRVMGGEPLVTFRDYLAPSEDRKGPSAVFAAKFDAEGDIIPDEFRRLILFTREITPDGLKYGIVREGTSYEGDEKIVENMHVELYFRLLDDAEGGNGLELDTQNSFYSYNDVVFKFQPKRYYAGEPKD